MNIDQIDNTQLENQNRLSWESITKISGRKADRKGQIE